MKIVSLAALAALALSGCSGLLTSKEPPATLYTLRAPADMPPMEVASGQSRPVVSIPAPSVPPGFDTGKIALLFDEGRKLDYFAGAQWPSNLGSLLQDVTLETARRTMLNAVAVDPDMGIPSQYRLALKVNEFQPVYKARPDSLPGVMVSLNFRLIRYPEESLIRDLTLGQTAPQVNNSLTSITASLESALQAILKEGLTEVDRAIAIDASPARAAPQPLDPAE